MKFEKIQPGMVLYDVHRHKMGNTTMSSVGVWPVEILEVDAERRRACVVWNGNIGRPQWYSENSLSKLRAKEPTLVKSGLGYRIATRAELAAMKAQS